MRLQMPRKGASVIPAIGASSTLLRARIWPTESRGVAVFTPGGYSSTFRIAMNAS